MIIKSGKRLPLMTTDRDVVMPVLPVRSALIFPGEIHTIQIGRRENLELLEAVGRGDNLLVLSYSPKGPLSGKSPMLSQVGVVARIQSVKEAMGDSRMVTLEGLRRITLMDLVESGSYIQASVAELAEPAVKREDVAANISEIMELVSHLIRLDSRYAEELMYTLGMNQSSPGPFADRVGSVLHFQLADKQKLLDTIPVAERLKAILRLINVEIENTATLANINDRVTESLERKKRESFLRQQLMEIRRELGEEFIEEDIARFYQKRIRDLPHVPAEVAGRLNAEANRLKHLSSSSAEYGYTKNYIELLLSLPWGEKSPLKSDLKQVEDIIGEGYYGQAKIKEQVLEYLATREMSKDTHDVPILCFAGPVGTGKASLAKAIARSMGRPLVRINGTSLIEVDDIRGIHRNEMGAGPGEFMLSIQREESFDLVMYLEDLEYVIESEDSNALLALLEAVDPRQNSHFIDDYVGVPMDFSRILFILGVFNSEDFPEPFSHRMEIVEMPGYIEREKIIITKRHILPKLYKRYGLTRSELKFADKTLSRIIRQYTMEAGLNGLQQQLQKVFRRVTRLKAAGETCKFTLSEKTVDEFLGTPIFIPEKAMTEPEIGVANGLAWTGAGGDLMLIEGLKMRGTGQVTTTGLLGDVMKESIQAAHSFIRSRADTLGIDHDDFVNFDIHIHFPMGSIPKDGPSAGITVAVVLASVMAERPVRSDIALTGEITLRGKIIPVGGIKEKVSAAYRAGIHTIILPKENQKDLKDLPHEIIRKTAFILIDSIDELFEQALLDFQPSAFTLEKLFNEEIEKAKTRTRKPARKRTTKKPKAATKKKKPAKKPRKSITE